MLADDDVLREFISEEFRDMILRDVLKKKIDAYNAGVVEYKYGFQRDNNESLNKVIGHIATILTESIYSKISEKEINQLRENSVFTESISELAFCISAAKTAQELKSNKVNLVMPKLLDMNKRRTDIIKGMNAQLAFYMASKKLVPNDIHSNSSNNLFILEGPNNGGKTTYIRSVGQISWLAQIGMFVPAQSAELSIVDGIYTSFGGVDTPGQAGQYLTELRRMAKFILPNNGSNVTPYSLVLFDEFANGTDHVESVNRTRIVLNHLSEKGVTAYFTTHKHEIGDMVERGEIIGSMNLAAEVIQNQREVKQTYKILRNARGQSHGYVIAEQVGITEENLKGIIQKELKEKKYKIEDTRMNYAQIVNTL